MSINIENIQKIFFHGQRSENQIDVIKILNLISEDIIDEDPFAIPYNNIFINKKFTTENIDGNKKNKITIIMAIHRLNNLVIKKIKKKIIIKYEFFVEILEKCKIEKSKKKLFKFKLLEQFYIFILNLWINEINKINENKNNVYTKNLLELIENEKKKMESGLYFEFYHKHFFGDTTKEEVNSSGSSNVSPNEKKRSRSKSNENEKNKRYCTSSSNLKRDDYDSDSDSNSDSEFQYNDLESIKSDYLFNHYNSDEGDYVDQSVEWDDDEGLRGLDYGDTEPNQW